MPHVLDLLSPDEKWENRSLANALSQSQDIVFCVQDGPVVFVFVFDLYLSSQSSFHLSQSQDIVFCVQDGPVVWRRLMLGPFTATTDHPYSAHPTQGLVFVFAF